MCGFIAQLVEHRTGIAEVTGSNPVEALIFFRLLHSNCLNWKFTAKITYHLHVPYLLVFNFGFYGNIATVRIVLSLNAGAVLLVCKMLCKFPISVFLKFKKLIFGK